MTRLFLFLVLIMSICSSPQAADREEVINLLCEMSGEVSGVAVGEMFSWEIPRKAVSVRIEQVYFNNDPNNVYMRIVSDDPTNEYLLRMSNVYPTDNHSDENKYHIREVFEDTKKEVVINRFTGTINYHEREARENFLEVTKYSGTCKKYTEQQF